MEESFKALHGPASLEVEEKIFKYVNSNDNGHSLSAKSMARF
jgi:hypothetical protein